MAYNSYTSKPAATFNRHRLHLRWPRIWIIILGIILIFLCLCIAGMEVGHTIFDVYRSTAFGGFILFIPLLICAIFVLITACKPKLILLRIAVILCLIMILLCMLLMAYDILVLIDPTRCFFLNCNWAPVYLSNSTYNATITGWPIYITWPSYFQTNMNAKRIFQSIQILCAGLFILFASLYLLTYFIYRHIKIQKQQHTMYNADGRTFITNETHTPSPVKYSNNVSQSYPAYNPQHKITTYSIEGQPYVSTQYRYSTPPPPPQPQPVSTRISPRKREKKTIVRARSHSVNYDQVCTRCSNEPRMILTNNYERQNFFSHLCIKCNHEVINNRRKLPVDDPRNNRQWRP